jgi:hypothetical protein
MLGLEVFDLLGLVSSSSPQPLGNYGLQLTFIFAYPLMPLLVSFHLLAFLF